MRVALASPRVGTSVDDCLAKVERLMREAAARDATIVCFPEAYVPGLRGLDFDVPAFEWRDEERALASIAAWAREYRIATIVGMEHVTDAGRQIAAFVFDRDGTPLGAQTKNQLDPTEERYYIPGTERRVFDVDGLRFGIAICHEGWRYPETVRWAASRGAKIVFHPQLTGTVRDGVRLTRWASADAPYYEKAMMCRALENTIYFASVNYAMPFQESATAIIDPSGECVAFLAYAEDGVLVHDIDLDRATGLLAQRYAPHRYQDATD